MYYTKAPAPPSWYKDGEQLFDEQQKDSSRKKLCELARDKKLHAINERLFVSKEILADLKTNEIILGRVLSTGRSFIWSNSGYRDVRVIGKINTAKSTSSVIVKDMQGNVISDDSREMLINLNLYPESQNVEVDFKWIAISEKGPIAAVAVYPGFVSKFIEGVGLKWKK